MPRISSSIPPDERDSTRTLVAVAVTIGALYFGQEIFIPIALAILLSFVLAPAVRKLHAWGLGRVFPVLLTTAFAFTVIFGLAGVLASQLKDVANDLPSYEGTMTQKIAALKGATSGGLVQKLETMAAKLDRALNRTPPQATAAGGDQAPSPRQAAPATAGTQPPIPVLIQSPARTSIETLTAFLSPLIHPLATGGIVVIFVLFILLQREDLRNRLIRLVGASDLQRTTSAINDGAKRLSRYLLTQLLLNATTGLLIGIAAWVIGVPNPILWGILFAVMRFVPYIGPIIGGALPAIFAAVVDPGWSTALWMAGVVLGIELLVGQVLEPFLYGHHTGLSPVAVVVSATFWTALWGPVGLLLATPLTVCLVVIGRHVDQLEFLDVLLGDRPPLTAPETFYQRMLANDPTEVSDQAQECLKTMSVTDYYDKVLLPGLLLAQEDVSAERLSIERQIQIRDATDEVIDDLEDLGAATGAQPGWRQLVWGKSDPAEAPPDESTAVVPPSWAREGAVLCIGSRGPLDDCAAVMLAQILNERGIGARAENYTSLSKAEIEQLDVSHTRLICLSSLDGSSSAYLRFALRRIRRKAPHARILVGAWWIQTRSVAQPDDVDEVAFKEPFATTIIDAVHFCLAAAAALSEDELSTADRPAEDEVPAAS